MAPDVEQPNVATPVQPPSVAAPEVTATEQTPDPVVDDGGSSLLWTGGISGAVLLLGAVAFMVLRKRPQKFGGFEPEPQPLVSEAQNAEPSVPPVTPQADPQRGLSGLLRGALSRSRDALGFDRLFSRKVIDDSLYEDLEEALLSSDVGVHTTDKLIERIKQMVKEGETDPNVLRTELRDQIRNRLRTVDVRLEPPDRHSPWVILVVGVNGSGKTTTIGKLAARLQGQGHRVMLAAADTYRAAASDQLKVWANRAGCDILVRDSGTDPGAVVYDALTSANARGHDVVIIDTAGRLQTARPLMEQLTKIRRVVEKVVGRPPDDTLLVLDGTMGQNGLSQANLFNEATPLTGVAVTKLDGTAKGGMILTLAFEMDLPIKLIGIGEGIDDLRDFDAAAFAEALT
jgi:fused signal recognition particle receptor